MSATRMRFASVAAGVCVLLAAGSANGSTYSDKFGRAVDVGGGVTIIGARADEDHTWSGSAYIFSTATGNEVHYLTAYDGYEFQGYGASVAIDGLLAAVGASSDDQADTDAGATYVYDVGTGGLLHKLMADDATDHSYLGSSVSISGTQLLAGASGADGQTWNSGVAYVFNAVTGSQTWKLTASDGGTDDEFGLSAALSGNRAVIGAPGHESIGALNGAAYVFDSSTGQEVFKLTPTIDAGSVKNFGASVAVDGDLAVVGAPGSGAGFVGAAYVYDVTTGAELFKLADPGASLDQGFGDSVAVSGDLAIVGAPHYDGFGTYSGKACVFDLTSGDFLYSLLAPSPGSGDLFGFAVGLDGDTAVIGAPYADTEIHIPEDPIYEDPGEAHIFDLTGPTHTHTLTGPGVVYVPDDEIDPDEFCQHMGDPAWDLDGDGDCDEDDFIYLIEHLVYLQDGSDRVGTKRGDFNLDGLVNATDLAIMKPNFGLSGMVYTQGNNNCDAVINGTDLAILAMNFGYMAPPAPVPEPGCVGLLLIGSLAALRRKGRRG